MVEMQAVLCFRCKGKMVDPAGEKSFFLRGIRVPCVLCDGKGWLEIPANMIAIKDSNMGIHLEMK